MSNFYKYHGTGNDFVLIDNRSKSFNDTTENIAQICHRRFGVGADGLILLENKPGYDFSIQYYNANGKIGSLCGNGSRCAVKFASDLEIIKDQTTFFASDGSHQARIQDKVIHLSMNDVSETSVINDGYFIDTGSPHLIFFSKNIDDIDVRKEGATIRYSPYWTKRGGVNVNYVEVIDSQKLKMRTYERGVEAETYSCGTGAVAAALASHIHQKTSNNIAILTKGGILNVAFEKSDIFTKIILSGPAKRVFSGNF